MAVMTLDSEILLGLLTEVGRARVLADHETDLIEEIVTMDAEPFTWNPRLDQGLVRASASNGGITRFAKRHRITPMAAYCRLSRIRGRKGRKAAQRRRARQDAKA